jgi:hypothetical protein
METGNIQDDAHHTVESALVRTCSYIETNTFFRRFLHVPQALETPRLTISAVRYGCISRKRTRQSIV